MTNDGETVAWSFDGSKTCIVRSRDCPITRADVAHDTDACVPVKGGAVAMPFASEVAVTVREPANVPQPESVVKITGVFATGWPDESSACIANGTVVAEPTGTDNGGTCHGRSSP